MEETGTIEFVRNAVIASVCGHSRGIGGKPCFRLLSDRPWVRIPPGSPKSPLLKQKAANSSLLTQAGAVLFMRDPSANRFGGCLQVANIFAGFLTALPFVGSPNCKHWRTIQLKNVVALKILAVPCG